MPSENKSNVCPYVSLGRLRLVQKLLTQETYGDKRKPLDAIFCAIGEDSDYSDGSLDLVNFLLLDAFLVDLKSAQEDEIDDDFMIAIRENRVNIYCNPSNYDKLIDRVVFWPNLHIHCIPRNEKQQSGEPEDQEDDYDETQDKIFKMSAMTEMLRGCTHIGVPLTPFKVKRFGNTKHRPFSNWPIVKAIDCWSIKNSTKPDTSLDQMEKNLSIKISKSLLRPVDISDKMLKVDGGLDPMNLNSCLISNVNQLQRQMENVGNVLDVKGKNPSDITESKLGDILRLYTKFGRIANREKTTIEKPFVLFGINTRKEVISHVDQNQQESIEEDHQHSLSAEGVTHMIIKAVEPLTGISCTRTYFLSDSWNKEAKDTLIIARIYSDLVDITLKAIDMLASSSSSSVTEVLVKDHLAKKLKELPENVSHGGWELRLEGLRQDGSSVPLKDGADRKCFKKATILIYDVAVKDARSNEERNLGSLAFADTFIDSSVQTKDYRGAIGRREKVFVLTEGIRRFCTWALPLRTWPPIPPVVGNKVLLSADGFQVRARTGFNSHPISCHVTITEDELRVSTRRLGIISMPICEVEEIVFDSGDSSSRGVGEEKGINGISTLIIKLRFGCNVPLPPSLANADRQIQLFIYSESKGMMELQTHVIPHWESLEKPPFIFSKSPLAVDVSDRHWVARRLATLGVVGVNGLTSLGSMGLKRLGTNNNTSASSNSNGNANFLDANFKDFHDFAEHFLFDFALGGKALPLEETDRLLKRGNREENSADGAASNDQVNITLINGIPGSFKESMGSCITSLSKDGIRWFFLRHPSDVTVFDAAAFNEILESLVKAFKSYKHKQQQKPSRVQREMRAVIVVPGFTPTARVLASITCHPKPEVRRRLKVGTVIACVNPENVFVDGYQVMPFVADHCSRGFVNHLILTGSESAPETLEGEDEERYKGTLCLLERLNPSANVILAPRGQFRHANDFNVILRDNSFNTREMAKMRHLLFPGWWESERELEGGKEGSKVPKNKENASAAAMGAKIWPHTVTSIAFKFARVLDKKKLARELRVFKTRGRDYAGSGDAGKNGVIFVVTGDLKFEEGGKMIRLNYSAAADKLTCFEMEEGNTEQSIERKKKANAEEKTDADVDAGQNDGEETTSPENPSTESEVALNRVTFSGYNLREEEIRELLLRSVKGDTFYRKTRKREEEVTVRELSEIQRKNATKPMPEGWFFNGHSYVHMDGDRSQNHPSFQEFLEEYLIQTNVEVEKHNKNIEALAEQFELSEMSHS